MIYEYVKACDTSTLQDQIRAQLSGLSHLETEGTALKVHFSSEISLEQKATLDGIVSAHNGMSSVRYLSNYLDSQVFPFTQELIRTFAAENIALGITQAGKTGHVLSLFTKLYPIPDASHMNTLKNSFDTGSLHMSVGIIQYVRDNPSEYSGLSPFITDARLLSMKNKIEAFLGVTLST